MPAENLSQGHWDMIAEHLPALPARYATPAFDFRLRSRQEKLAGIWDAIFQDLTWVSIASSTGGEPVLIGKDLDDSSYNNVSNSKEELFFQSLRAYKAPADSRELELTAVVLNVAHRYGSRDRLYCSAQSNEEHSSMAAGRIYGIYRPAKPSYCLTITLCDGLTITLCDGLIITRSSAFQDALYPAPFLSTPVLVDASLRPQVSC